MAEEKSKSDEQKYTELVGGIIDSTLVGSCLAIAYETGVLQVLIDATAPVTSPEIADAKSLKERYVREVLKCLACAKVVQVEKDAEGTLRYHVTASQAQVLQGPSTMMMGMLGAQAARFAGMMEIFKLDGPYSYPFAEDTLAMDGIEKIGLDRLEAQVALVLDTFPGIQHALESGINVIEYGSGRGHFIEAFARKFPKSKFVGGEYTDSQVQILNDRLNTLNLDNLEFRKLDILDSPDELSGQFDFALVNDVIHDIPDSLAGLRTYRRVLKTGSYFAFIDIDGTGDVMEDKEQPGYAGLYAISTFLCVPQGYHHANAQAYGTCWGRHEAARLATEAGFKVLSQLNHCGVFVLHVCQAV